MMSAAAEFPHLLIRASAGTGKTFQLSNRFIAQIAAGEPPDHILAATFARKAAGEILERVLTRLAEAALDDGKFTELAENVGDAKLTRDGCFDLLRKLISRLHRLRVGTLDGFFSQLAASFSLELGLPPGWRIVDELDDLQLRNEAVQTVLDGESTSSLVTMMHLLSKGEIKRSVSSEIHDVVTKLYELFCETDDDAWDALPRHKQIDGDALEAAIARLAALEFTDKRFGKARDANVGSATGGDWEGFIGKGLAAKLIAGATEFYKKPIESDVVDAYRPLIDNARAVLLGRVADQTRAARQLLDKFDAAYRQLKQSSHGLRFDDVTRSLARGFANGRIADVNWRLDMQVKHLLLDEFQDTSRLQWQVVRPFAERVTAADGDGSFFCVGDVKQAIYRWRGGVSEIFDAVGEQLGGIDSESLTKSYRSSQPVIDTVNRVFLGLKSNETLAKYPNVTHTWGERFGEHTTARGELPGYCRLMTSRRADDNGKQRDVTLDFAAGQIAEITRENPGRSVGVLVRTNSAVARLIYQLRTQHQVLASEEGGNPLTDSPAVQLILSLLRIADHPGDTAARFHLATSPLAKTVDFQQHDDDTAAVRVSLKLRESLLNRGYGKTVYQWVQELAPHCDGRDLNRLLQLVELAYGYENDATVRVDDFIRVVESRRVESPSTADVRVMTLHQAKGLQFDIVVLPELDVKLKALPPAVVVGRDGPIEPVRRICRYVNANLQSLLPPEFQRMFTDWEDQSVNESLCLLYVALTRAVHALHMIIPPAKENERSLPKSAAGLLREALTDTALPSPEQVLYEHGDPTPLADESAGSAGGVGEDAETERVKVKLRAAPAQRTRGLDRRSPSGLEGGTAVDLAKRLRLDTSPAMARGSLFHAWFEAIEWLDDGPPDEATLRNIAGPLSGAEINLDTELAAFHKMLARKSIQQALSRSAYDDPSALGFAADVSAELQTPDLRMQVFREREFAIRDGDAVLKGAIDRLVVFYDGDQPVAADVVDFKTDRIDDTAEDSLQAKVEFYRPQIEAYRRTTSKLTGLDTSRIAARLLFVGAGVVELIENRDA